MIDRLPPPQDIEVEKVVLGTCLVYPDIVHQLGLTSDMFYKDLHKKIFAAILEVSKNGGCDLVTVTSYLMESGPFNEPVYMAELTSSIFSEQMAGQYALIVKEKYLKREYIRASQEILEKAFSDIDLAELIDFSESSLFKLSDVTQARDIEKLSKIIDEELAEIQKIINKEKKLTGIPSGFTDIDRATGGWQEENLIIIAARPSMGKTALALTLCQNAASLKYPFGLFSLEMSRKELATRFLSSASDYSNVQIRNAEINLETLVSKSWDVSGLPIWVDDSPAISLYELRSKIKKMVVRNGVKGVVIDYLQLMKGEGDSREQEVSTISRGLKAISKEFHIPVIALSQLNRKCEERKDKRPMLSDLRESGAIEQDADMVCLLWRPAYYGINTVDIDRTEESSEGVLFIDVAKNRNGKTGDFVVYHNESMTKIKSVRDELNKTPY